MMLNRRQKLLVSVILASLILVFAGITYAVTYGGYQFLVYLVVGLFSFNLLMALFRPRIRKWVTKS